MAATSAWQPPAWTFGAFALLGGAAALGLVGASDGSDASRNLVRSAAWLSWVALSGVALVVFGAMTAIAVPVLSHRGSEGLTHEARRRNAYLAAAALLVVVLGLVRLVSGGANPQLPVDRLEWRTGAVLLSGMLACVPWLAIVWLAHAACLEIEVTEVESGAAASSSPALRRLLYLRGLILTIVTVFTVVVVVAILCSGSLRAAFLVAHPDRSSEFPPTNVLLYGALFAILLALVTLPLVSSWRTRARKLVDRLYPEPSADRKALESRLGLDVPIVRSPITALHVFTPLLTTLLAAFVPQLAK